MGAVVSLEALKERIQQIEGRSVRTRRVPSGVPALDRLTDGLPSPGVLELSGPLGSGRTRLSLAVVKDFVDRGLPVAWIDPRRRLHPPAADAMGVALDRLLLVRPASDREAWSVEQIARSGCFPMVIIADPTTSGGAARVGVGQRLLLAAEAGGCTLVVLDEHPWRQLPATVRIRVSRDRLVVLRDRNGLPGVHEECVPWPDHTSPWGGG